MLIMFASQVGGAVGVMAHDQLADWSHTAAMMACAISAVLGCVVTLSFVPEDTSTPAKQGASEQDSMLSERYEGLDAMEGASP